MSITVYSKLACVQCTATTRALDARGITFDVGPPPRSSCLPWQVS